MTRHHKDLGSAFDSLRSKGGWGGGKKEKKEGGREKKKEGRRGGKKGEGIGERRKGTPARVTPFCLPLQGCSANQTGNFS